MTWNYRVMRVRGDHEPYLALREVHYDEDCRPTSYSETDATFLSDDAEASTEILASLAAATSTILSTPILDQSVFDLPVEERPTYPRTRRPLPADAPPVTL